VSRRSKGGEKERGRENWLEIPKFRPDMSLYPAKDPVGRGFRLEIRPSASDPTSPTPCPNPVVRLSRRPKREEEEREGEGEGEMSSRLEREIFFFKGDEVCANSDGLIETVVIYYFIDGFQKIV
jgi:hypothetical protein